MLTSRGYPRSDINLPNALTLGRIAAVPVFVLVLYFLDGALARWTAFAVFALASFTDWLDGHLARALQQQSRFGAMLDPIADKLLVAAALLMLVADNTISGVNVFAALIILSREILVSGLREFLATLNVKVAVTTLAKWKTAIQMIAIALLIIAPALAAALPLLLPLGVGLLWIAALLTLWTGSDYFRAAIHHASSSNGS
ncbi:MAG: CDP-diacylglycerol--glycerol-3-phosphate 3-phosphatidyltransferase [Alphaproteobacteria bacterium]|nr:CDP-diacylglycerol--glycerol-3-phosphate 3-phosphatidyltransferase [Alphaproteobacteria bacterium]